MRQRTVNAASSVEDVVQVNDLKGFRSARRAGARSCPRMLPARFLPTDDGSAQRRGRASRRMMARLAGRGRWTRRRQPCPTSAGERTAAAASNPGPAAALRRPHQPMLLASGRQLDRAVPGVAQRDDLTFLGHRRIVHPRAAAADQPPRFAIARGQARQREQPERRDAGLQFGPAAPTTVGKRLRRLAFLERRRGGFRRRVGGCLAVRQSGGRGGQQLLRLVDLGAWQRFQPGDFRLAANR